MAKLNAALPIAARVTPEFQGRAARQGAGPAIPAQHSHLGQLRGR